MVKYTDLHLTYNEYRWARLDYPPSISVPARAGANTPPAKFIRVSSNNYPKFLINFLLKGPKCTKCGKSWEIDIAHKVVWCETCQRGLMLFASTTQEPAGYVYTKGMGKEFFCIPPPPPPLLLTGAHEGLVTGFTTEGIVPSVDEFVLYTLHTNRPVVNQTRFSGILYWVCRGLAREEGVERREWIEPTPHNIRYTHVERSKWVFVQRQPPLTPFPLEPATSITSMISRYIFHSTPTNHIYEWMNHFTQMGEFISQMSSGLGTVTQEWEDNNPFPPPALTTPLPPAPSLTTILFHWEGARGYLKKKGWKI